MTTSFATHARLFRHVHVSRDGKRLAGERVRIADGPILVELQGIKYLVLPGTELDIGAGVPHMWSGVPAGILLPSGECSRGVTIMYFHHHEQNNGFELCQETSVIKDPAFKRFEGDPNALRFPDLSLNEILARPYIWGGEIRQGDLGVFSDPEFREQLAD